MLKRSPFFKPSSQASPSQLKDSAELTIKHITSLSKSPVDSEKRSDDAVQDLTVPLNEEDLPDDDDELTTAAAKIPLDEILGKRSNSFFKDSFRYNPLNSCNETTSSVSKFDAHFHLRTISDVNVDVLVIKDCSSIEEETRCVVCNANFPSVWLLEQHASLQHANLGPLEEKPFICEQCGQSYRYRSAYVKHREQNHRARLPADKLFTCDVCGMQFRYLKSFKKHRLNHALERLHGKCERRLALQTKPSDLGKMKQNACDNSNDIVTSSNEAIAEETGDASIIIKTEEEDEEQDDTIDSPTATTTSGGRGNPMASIDSHSRSKITNDVIGQLQRNENNFLLKVSI